jgi:hypothetical protein
MHRKLDEVIRDSFRLGLEEEERTDEGDLDFSPDYAGESDCSDGASRMQDHSSSESSSDDEPSGMGRADLENSITDLWDARQEITEADARWADSSPRGLETPPRVIPWTFGEMTTQSGSRILRWLTRETLKY